MCRKVDGQDELPILWKNPEEELLDNSVIAHKHLDNLVRCLRHDGLCERYDQEVNKILDANYAELVPNESLQNVMLVWYLLHHCIQNPHKPDKLFILFNCAAKYQGYFLNESWL